MSQFALYRLRGGGEIVCRIQSDLGTDTAYILSAPVVARAGWGMPVPLLHVPVTVAGDPHLVLMTQMVALPASELGTPIGSAEGARDDIIRAVDLLVTGF
ncbi:CcdB family protein [Sulfitobacter sp. HNIBRBA3233]|uniref:CcdB family protein n=1 Tax=Sulfitobacter marinivivus TaxID=3158558 RepID=UPI0032DF965E